LTAVSHVPVDDPKCGVKVATTRVPLAGSDTVQGIMPITRAWAGLEPKLKDELEKMGYKVQFKGERPGRLPAPRPPQSGGNSPDDAVLEFVRRRERGLVRYDPAHVRVERIVAQIAEAWPKKRILIVATRQNDVLYLRRWLEDRGMRVGKAFYGGASRGKYRIAVTTYSGVGTGLADARNRDIAIYLNPPEAFCRAGCWSLAALGPARLYGLMPTNMELPSPVNELVSAVFGQESVCVPKHGRTARRVQVAFVPSNLAARVVLGEDDLAARKRLVWHHVVRNRRIAEIAQAAAREDHDKLDRLSPGLGRAVWKREDVSICVLVESVEHGLSLRRHLPGWRVIADKAAVTDGFTASDAARVSDVDGVRRLATYNAIVTMSAMPDAIVFDIIIRADAGLDIPALGWHLLGHHGADDELLLVDFDDRHHPQARKWTRSRKAAYGAAGWFTAGGPQVCVEDRMHAANRIKQPVLPYQTPGKYRWLKGEQRTAKYRYEKRRERRREKLKELDGGQITLRQIADPDHLVDSFRKLVEEGGPAAGIDGISPRDISILDFGPIAAKLSAALLDKTWRPRKTRQQPIPKPGTDEYRILKIGVTLDRVVGKALHEKLQPFLEKVYLRNSFGFRPGRSVWQMLAELTATMEKHDRWVLAIDDVRKAFDNVKIAEAMKGHQTAMQNRSQGKQPMLADDALEIIETVLRGHDDHDMGIDQGGCYSPDALNTFLHVVHDTPLDAVDAVLLWFRYADNLVYAVQSVSEGRRVLTRVRRLLRKVGLSLKGKDGIADLDAGDRATVLGFTLWREDGRLRIGLKEGFLDQLREHLAKAWETSDPNMTARTVLRGWINANGPAFENGVTVIPDVLHLAARLGFRELPGTDELTGWWAEAWERWLVCSRRARRRVVQRVRH
jgi:retron-type reverse transcriptase